jgi:hypothetical protein
MLRAPEELPLAALINRAILEQLVATSEWDALRRAGTIGDQLCSVIATATVAALNQTTLERLTELSAAEAAAQSLFEQAEALDEVAAQKGGRAADLHARAEMTRRAAEQRHHMAADLAAQLEADADSIEDAARRAGRAGLQSADANSMNC